MARFIDSVCDERISFTTGSRKAVKGARRCLQRIPNAGSLRTLLGPYGEGN